MVPCILCICSYLTSPFHQLLPSDTLTSCFLAVMTEDLYFQQLFNLGLPKLENFILISLNFVYNRTVVLCDLRHSRYSLGYSMGMLYDYSVTFSITVPLINICFVSLSESYTDACKSVCKCMHLSIPSILKIIKVFHLSTYLYQYSNKNKKYIDKSKTETKNIFNLKRFMNSSLAVI